MLTKLPLVLLFEVGGATLDEGTHVRNEQRRELDHEEQDVEQREFSLREQDDDVTWNNSKPPGSSRLLGGHKIARRYISIRLYLLEVGGTQRKAQRSAMQQ